MQILSKVESIEVKRAFVTAKRMRALLQRGENHLPKISRAEFLRALRSAKAGVRGLTEKQLDAIIGKGYPKRVAAYNAADWYRAKMSTREIGVWRGAGGLPTAWTCCSLAQTAVFVKAGLGNIRKPIHAKEIPSVQEHADVIHKEHMLFPIIFAGGTGTRGRTWCRIRTAGDTDDGCMRSIALALSGRRTLTAYLGKPKKLRR